MIKGCAIFMVLKCRTKGLIFVAVDQSTICLFYKDMLGFNLA